MILGIGTDFVNIERIRKVLYRFGELFENEFFLIKKSKGREKNMILHRLTQNDGLLKRPAQRL